MGFYYVCILLFQNIQTCAQNVQACTYGSLCAIYLLENVIAVISIVMIVLLSAVRSNHFQFLDLSPLLGQHQLRLLILLLRLPLLPCLPRHQFSRKIALNIFLLLLLLLQIIMLPLNELLNRLTIQILIFALKSSLFTSGRYLCSWFESAILYLSFLFLFRQELDFVILVLLVFVPVVFKLSHALSVIRKTLLYPGFEGVVLGLFLFLLHSFLFLQLL